MPLPFFTKLVERKKCVRISFMVLYTDKPAPRNVNLVQSHVTAKMQSCVSKFLLAGGHRLIKH